jgi:hypothetical protein
MLPVRVVGRCVSSKHVLIRVDIIRIRDDINLGT